MDIWVRHLLKDLMDLKWTLLHMTNTFWIWNNYVKEVSLEEIFQRADFVSLHTPLSSETIGMMNSSFLRNSKNLYRN